MYDDAHCAQLVSTFCQFFVDNVRCIRDNVSAALQSQSVARSPSASTSSFEPVTAEAVRKLLSGMPSKSSPLDVLPCSLLKSLHAHMLTPAIARLANLSLQTGNFPARSKRAQVLPLLKKAGLDSSQLANYRPISNLPTVSKVLERLVLARLRPHLLSSANFSQFQSAYRKGHSTETALLEVLDGVFTAADDKQVTVMRYDTIRDAILTCARKPT